MIVISSEWPLKYGKAGVKKWRLMHTIVKLKVEKIGYNGIIMLIKFVSHISPKHFVSHSIARAHDKCFYSC
jgi:hypothetical protein